LNTNDDDRPLDDGGYRSSTAGRSGGRRRAAAGALGFAALLGAGAYLMSGQVADRNGSTERRDVEAIGGLAPSTLPEPSASVSAVPADSASAAVSAGSSPPASAATKAPGERKSPAADRKPAADSKKVRKEIRRARAAAAKDGHPLQRALTPKEGKAAAAGVVNQRNETTPEGTLRVLTARHDLSGQRELLMAADEGFAVGAARCTQRFRFSAGDQGRERPTMMLCWRTSANRSVVTLAVAKKGRPSAASSAVVINREWSRLG